MLNIQNKVALLKDFLTVKLSLVNKMRAVVVLQIIYHSILANLQINLVLQTQLLFK